MDPQHKVLERNESKNLWSKLVTNLAIPNLDHKPDLIVKRVSFTPENPDYYSRVMIHVELENIGAGSAVFCNSTIWMSTLEGQLGGGGGGGNRVIIPNEVIGGGIFISDVGELENGCYRVFVKVDSRNSVEESNENNNSYTAYLSVGGASCQSLITQDRIRGWTTTMKLEDVPLDRINTEPMVRIR